TPRGAPHPPRLPCAHSYTPRVAQIEEFRYIDHRRCEVPMTKLDVIATVDSSVAGCATPLAAPLLDEREAETTAELFKALADPARVRICNELAQSDEPVCACEFEPALGLSQPTVSHHLKKLTDAGLLE